MPHQRGASETRRANLADLDVGGAVLDEQLCDDAVFGGVEGHGGLVRLDVPQRVAGSHFVADLDVPLLQRARRHCRRERRERDHNVLRQRCAAIMRHVVRGHTHTRGRSGTCTHNTQRERDGTRFIPEA